MKKKALFFLMLLATLSCSKKEVSENVIVENDFEGIVGWGFENPSLTKDRAHSGRYSIKVDNAVEFSLTFKQVLGMISTRKPKKIGLEFWAYVPEDTKTAFILSINNATTDQPVFRDEMQLKKATSSYRQWTKITKEFELPAGINFSDKLACYLWRQEGSNSATYIDDLKISVID